MIEEPMPVDVAPEELAELVASDTRRRLLSGLDELMMLDPTQPYEPRVTHLVIDITALDDDIKNHWATGKQIQDIADRLQDEHLPMFDRCGIVEYNRDKDRIRTTKSTMLFAAAIDEIEDAVDTNGKTETCRRHHQTAADMSD